MGRELGSVSLRDDYIWHWAYSRLSEHSGNYMNYVLFTLNQLCVFQYSLLTYFMRLSQQTAIVS
jgi:hypothetical protein